MDLAAFWQEIFESGVCIFAVFDVVELLQRRIFLSVIPGRQILRVLGMSKVFLGLESGVYFGISFSTLEINLSFHFRGFLCGLLLCRLFHNGNDFLRRNDRDLLGELLN